MTPGAAADEVATIAQNLPRPDLPAPVYGWFSPTRLT
jgi:hypothetical protein